MADEYVADKAVFVDADDQIVDANDPAKVRKVVDVGGRLSAEDAAKYGLGSEGADDSDEGGEPADEEEGAPAKTSTKKTAAKSGRKARK